MTYEAWNDALASNFFNAAQAGTRVYLHVTPEKLNTIAGSERGFADFVEAIKIGPAGFTGAICEKAASAKRNWRDRNTGYPPYLASLCFFALAADHEGDWPAHAYYPRLWHLLGEPDYGRPQGFEFMRLLWQDLEAWTVSDREGSLGIFKAQTAGRRVNVGLPIAQTILTEEERRRLPELFEAADLEPGAVLSPGALVSALIGHATYRLRRRTQHLLARADESDYRTELLEILQAELAEWDGTIPAQPNQASPPAAPRAGLRLWLASIDAAGFVKSRIVASLPENREAADLLLTTPAIPGKQFECPARSGPCSGALRDASDGQELTADQLPWESRLEFKCTLTGVRLILPAARLRIFVSALHTVQMGGFIETKLIPLVGEFYIVAPEPDASIIAQWGAQHCAEWREISARSGLRRNWRLFRGVGLRSAGNLAQRYAVFPPRASPKIRFEGGIRAGSGARYFPFALPDIVIESCSPPTAVRLNGTPLTDPVEGRYTVQHDIAQSVNVVDAIFVEDEVHELLYVLSDGWTWRTGDDCLPSDEFGQPTHEAGVCIRGADVQGGIAAPFILDPATAAESPAVLIGPVPGQIADLRRGVPLPEWSPVWMVAIRRREIVFSFCGTSIDDANPQPAPSGASTKKWSSFLWTTRKRTKIPRSLRLRALLHTYQEAAHAL